MAKLTKAQAARMVNRSERVVREWTERGHVPRELTTEHLARLRELAGYTKKEGDVPSSGRAGSES